MYRLDCGLQKYDWGRLGNDSSAALFKTTQNSDFTINPSQRYAELWMGTHPRGPSQLLNESNELVDLSSYLKSRGDSAIGSNISAKFYGNDSLMNHGDLPFLFKVLSIDKALSIQAHPNKTHAGELHRRDPKNYPDANHKPEMIIAISETFEAMCGFRVSSEIAGHFQCYSQLKQLCGEKNCENFVSANTAGNTEVLKSVLAECLRSLMSQSADVIKTHFDSLCSELTANENKSDLENLFLRLSKQYPNDVGCFVVFLLNCFTLNKGEAIYLAANIPHAYLFGEGVECMACSDNVVRAGLTPKFKDVETLCSMLDYTMRSASENKLSSTKTSLSQNKDYLCEFRPTVDEFSIQQVHITNEHLTNNNTSFLLPKSESGSILIVVEADSDSGSFQAGASNLQAKVGQVYFIDANVDVYFNVGSNAHDDSRNILLAYRAYCDIKA